MGLDMYFSADFYNGGGYDFRKNTPEEQTFNTILEVMNIPREIAGNSIEISVQVGYLRKANAIHNWLVQNIQDGVDECQKSYFSSGKVEELRNICREILNTVDKGDPAIETSEYNPDYTYTTYPNMTLNRKLAQSLLPPADGFFFGPTELNEWYVEDLEKAEKFLTTMLENPTFDSADFYYRSSW